MLKLTVLLCSFHSYYRPERSCGKVMFSQVSVSLLTGGGVSQHALGRHPLGRHPPARNPMEAHPPGSTHPWEARFPWEAHPPTATAVDGTHPTGMLSCIMEYFTRVATLRAIQNPRVFNIFPVFLTSKYNIYSTTTAHTDDILLPIYTLNLQSQI